MPSEQLSGEPLDWEAARKHLFSFPFGYSDGFANRLQILHSRLALGELTARLHAEIMATTPKNALQVY